MHAYTLSPEELKAIANLCLQEQGTLEGVKAEASLAANLLETHERYAKAYHHDIYEFMRTSEWFAKAAYWMDNGSAEQEHVDAVKEVLVYGKRTLPIYVDEHDCLSDIEYVRNGVDYFDKHDRSKYIKDVTIIKNRHGSVYVFYSFPNPNGDPFGYITKPEEDAVYIEL